MATEAIVASGLAQRYAAALYELADSQKVLDQVAEDLRTIRGLLRESPDLSRLIRSPITSRQIQGRALEAVLARAQISTLTRNFVGVVAENRRAADLPQMVEAFLALLAQRRGEIAAEVTSAQPLDDRQKASLDEQLRRALGSKVTVDLKVDPKLLGGLVIKVGSRLIDGSLEGKLQRLERAMKGA